MLGSMRDTRSQSPVLGMWPLLLPANMLHGGGELLLELLQGISHAVHVSTRSRHRLHHPARFVEVLVIHAVQR